MRPMRAIVRTPNPSATNEQTERLIVAFIEFAARTQMVHTLAARTLVARTLCCAHTMRPMRAIVRTPNRSATNEQTERLIVVFVEFIKGV